MLRNRQTLSARLALIAFALLGCAWLYQLDFGEKISTDVLDLVPIDERSPELTLVRQMADERVARVVLVALRFSQTSSEAAADFTARRDRAAGAFIESLRASPAFAEVVRLGDTRSFEAVGVYVFKNRLELLLPGWLASKKTEYAAQPRDVSFDVWLAEKTATELSTFLARPEAMAFQQMIPADPLLLVPQALEPWQGFAQTALGGDGRDVLIWTRSTASPLKEEGQGPVFKAVEEAELAAKRAGGDAMEVRWTGFSRFAEASRRRIESEMSGLNLLSIVSVLAIAIVGIRRPLKTLHLAPVLLFSLLGAWVATTAVFPRVHVLVFVVGSLLGGVAVDYGFYLFLQPPRRDGETAREKISRLGKPLLASALTTVIGFTLLLVSDLPVIRQLGVFVSAGLLSALAAALLWFLQSGETYLETRAFIGARIGNRNMRRTHVVLAACVVFALWGLTRLTWRDDIRDLEIPSAELRANDAEVRARFGETRSSAIYLTRGSTMAEARAALSRFLAWHTRTYPTGNALSVGSILPSPIEWADFPAHLQELPNFATALRGALERTSFEADAFEPFFTAWDELLKRNSATDYDALAAGLVGSLQGPLALMVESTPGACWFATVSDQPALADPPADVSTVSSAQLESLNRLFSRYRVSALRLSLAGLALVGLSVLVLYGVKRGARVFLLPLTSCLLAFGALGLAGQTLNLFHLLGAFLGVCLSHNYAIFSAENAARGDVPPPSIRLSAMTTAASFGVLALSRIPVISALGATVALIVLGALLLVELEPFEAPQPKRTS